MRSYVALTKRLADAAGPCFNDADRSFIDSEIAAGEYYFAVDDILRAAVREAFPLPANLIEDLRGWLNGHDGGVPAGDKGRFEQLVGRVRTKAPVAH